MWFIIIITYLLTYLITYLLTAVELSLGGSSPYTSTDKTNKNIYICTHINETVQKHRTNNTKQNKYKYTYYPNTHTIVKTPTHYKTHTYAHPHIAKQDDTN
jgi:hypothetical protein